MKKEKILGYRTTKANETNRVSETTETTCEA